MGNFRPLPTKCWERFLEYKGYAYNRTVGSHDQWTKKGSRTIPVWGDEKEIPAFHLRTSSKTIGCTIAEIYAWADKNCLKFILITLNASIRMRFLFIPGLLKILKQL